MPTVEETLAERQNTYGSFSGQADITQSLKDKARYLGSWNKLTDAQREAIDMIFSKIARILNGDPNFIDSWHDIAGYATLVEQLIVSSREIKPERRRPATAWAVPKAARQLGQKHP